MRFFTGDQQGSIKSLSCADGNTDLQTIHSTKSAVQLLSVADSSLIASGQGKLAAAYADGSCLLHTTNGNNPLITTQEWKETRLKSDQTFVGIHLTDRGTYTCTSNGALALRPEESLNSLLSSLPTRLRAWHLSSDHTTFAYGGEEVELSVWDVERGFSSSPQESDSTAKKRKRDPPLFSAEVWRAKNVPHDHLGLRQPVHITSLAYISESQHLVAGTLFGDLRRYDTRAARTPVCNWKGVGKKGSIHAIEKGFEEHQIFIADQGSNLYAIDLRNGQVIYGYKGISGAVTSLAVAPSFMASTALDRYSRIHSTFPPPVEVGQQQAQKGQILHKIYMNTIPTVIVWDKHSSVSFKETFNETDDVWAQIKTIS